MVVLRARVTIEKKDCLRIRHEQKAESYVVRFGKYIHYLSGKKEIWAPLKKPRLKRNKNSSTKAHYVTHSKLHQLEGHCDLFRKIAVLNTIPGSIINIKEIIGNYDCSSLTPIIFGVRDLPNHDLDRKSFSTCSFQFHR